MTSPDQNQRWQDLMIKVQNGDQSAYQCLLKEVRVVVVRYVRSKVFNQSLVEDITQDVLIGLHNARHTYHSTKPFKPWLNAIIRYKTIDAFRKIGRNREDEMATGDDIETFFPEETNKQEQAMVRRDLIKALSTLPDQQQKVVVLMKVHGLTAQEVGKIMGLSLSAVKVTAHRAYKAMKLTLTNEN